MEGLLIVFVVFTVVLALIKGEPLNIEHSMHDYDD